MGSNVWAHFKSFACQTMPNWHQAGKLPRPEIAFEKSCPTKKIEFWKFD